jgi:hypothetical protein
MRAINGILEDGRFTPFDVMRLPRRVSAILIINDEPSDGGKAERMAWLEEFDNAVENAAHEEMPDFPRARLNRGLVDLSDVG